MAQVLGGFLGVLLLSRFFRRAVPHTLPEFQRRAVADVVTGLLAIVLGAFGFANGGPPAWHQAIATYVPATLLVLVVDRVRAVLLTSPPNGTPIEDETTASHEQPATPPAAPVAARRTLRQWQVGLHGGQLLMLLTLGIPASLGGGVLALAFSSQASNAVDQIDGGFYAEGSRYVQLGGMTFMPLRAFPPDSIAKWKRRIAGAQADGWGGDSLIAAIRQAGFAHEPFAPTLASLSATAAHRYWAWPMFALSVALLLFCAQTLWVWLGARARPPASPTR